jgi:hypothetical protein
MVGTGGGGFGSGGGDNNEESLRKMIVNLLKASKLFVINIRTPEGLASLTTILGQALQAKLTAGEAQRDEEARKAIKAKAAEKKRKRDERATGGGKEEAPSDNIGRGGNSNQAGIHWGQEHH